MSLQLGTPRSAPLLAPEVDTWRPAPRAPAPAEAHEHAALGSRRRARRRWLSAFTTGVQIGLVGLVAWGLLFHFSVVRGSSMAPGIHDGDRIVVDHLAYVLGDVRRGDIVVLQYPLDPTLDYIKRVIGVPGDQVRIERGAVYVNGERIEEPYVAEPDRRAGLVTTVAPDTYFVLGDNRPHSSDSREFGLVPRDNIVGKVDLRVWPPARAGLLD